VNHDEWFVPEAETVPGSSDASDAIEMAEPTSSLPTLYVVSAAAAAERISETQLPLDFG
jgi:hypothetical protein